MNNQRTIRAALAALEGISVNKYMFPNSTTPPLQKHIIKRGHLTKNFRACCVIDTACTIFAGENRSYLGEFEAQLKKALAR
jgi:hypothetical protein